jgi:hypothetical protein
LSRSGSGIDFLEPGKRYRSEGLFDLVRVDLFELAA